MKIFKLSFNKNVNYKIPENNELLMMDFYLITELSESYKIYPRIINNKILSTLDEIKKSLLKHIKNKFLNEIYFAIASEFQHVLDAARIKNENIDYEVADFLYKYKEDYFLKIDKKNQFESDLSSNENYVYSFHLVENLRLESNYNKKDFINIAKYCFKNFKWSSLFGGKNWERICNGWLRLFNTKDTNEKDLISAIDNMYHLQHNTGSAFTKIDSYKINDSFQWIEENLDLKRDQISSWPLYEKCSPSLKPLISNVIHQVNLEHNRKLKKEPGDRFYLPVSYEEYKENPEIISLSREEKEKENEILIEEIIKENISKEETAKNHYDIALLPNSMHAWVLEKIKSGNFPKSWIYQINEEIENCLNGISCGNGNYILDYVKEVLTGEDLNTPNIILEQKRQWINKIDDVIDEYGYVPEFAQEWVKIKLQNEEYPEEWIGSFMKSISSNSNPATPVYDIIRTKLKFGNYPDYWDKYILNVIEKNQFAVFFETWVSKILNNQEGWTKGKIYLKEKIEEIIYNTIKIKGEVPFYSLSWIDEQLKLKSGNSYIRLVESAYEYFNTKNFITPVVKKILEIV